MTVACGEGHMDGMRKESLTALIFVVTGPALPLEQRIEMPAMMT